MDKVKKEMARGSLLYDRLELCRRQQGGAARRVHDIEVEAQARRRRQARREHGFAERNTRDDDFLELIRRGRSGRRHGRVSIGRGDDC